MNNYLIEIAVLRTTFEKKRKKIYENTWSARLKIHTKRYPELLVGIAAGVQCNTAIKLVGSLGPT